MTEQNQNDAKWDELLDSEAGQELLDDMVAKALEDFKMGRCSDVKID